MVSRKESYWKGLELSREAAVCGLGDLQEDGVATRVRVLQRPGAGRGGEDRGRGEEAEEAALHQGDAGVGRPGRRGRQRSHQGAVAGERSDIVLRGGRMRP